MLRVTRCTAHDAPRNEVYLPRRHQRLDPSLSARQINAIRWASQFDNLQATFLLNVRLWITRMENKNG